MLDLRLFTIRLGSYTFSPKLIPTVVTLLLLYLLYSLGQWQLSRAQFKDSLKQQIESRRDLTPVDIELLPAENQDKEFIPVQLTGRFDTSKNFLLDNKVLEMKVGYEVITPFQTQAGDWLLVNRGWIPQTKYRSDLPEIKTAEGEVQLTGFVRTPYKDVFMLAEQQYDLRQWPVIIQQIQLEDLSKVLDTKIKPYVVMLDKKSAAGFDRNWPAFKLDSEKHIGYAVQWFALFAALLGIFFIVNTKRKQDDE